MNILSVTELYFKTKVYVRLKKKKMTEGLLEGRGRRKWVKEKSQFSQFSFAGNLSQFSITPLKVTLSQNLLIKKENLSSVLQILCFSTQLL